MRKIRPVPIKEYLFIHWVAAQTINKVVARLDQGIALALRHDAYFSIVGASNAAHERY